MYIGTHCIPPAVRLEAELNFLILEELFLSRCFVNLRQPAQSVQTALLHPAVLSGIEQLVQIALLHPAVLSGIEQLVQIALLHPAVLSGIEL